jgi:hypothetical protein
MNEGYYIMTNQITATVVLKNDVKYVEQFSTSREASEWVASNNSIGILAEWEIDTGWYPVSNMLQSEINSL